MATLRWTGNAIATKQVTTITISGTWAQNDTATLTINGKDLVITIGTLVTTTQVATTIKEAFNGTTLTDTSASASPTIAQGGGAFIPEFNEITATSSAAVITLTADSTVGKPFTVTVSESTASTDGVVGTPSTTTAATGPHHFDNGDNWDTGNAPVDADDIWFDSGSVDCLYALSQSAITPTSINVTMNYTGKIGLPEYNSDTSGFTYREYREKYLNLGVSTDATNVAVNIGSGDGQGSGRIKLSLGDSQCTVNVSGTGQTAEQGVPTFLFKGTHASNELNVTKGIVGVAFYADDTATLATLRIGYQENQAGDSSVRCGAGTTLSSATISQSGGSLVTRSNVSAANVDGGTLSHESGTMGTLTVSNAVIYYKSNGTCTTGVFRQGGVLDCRRDMRARTFTNLTFYAASSLFDPSGTITATNGFDLSGASVEDLRAFIIPKHKTITLSAI
ncbi:MAG TPA: hypothetical protein VLA12_05025 [Planctomycetaceae bacterium]|nr:hypothetical protein [Planctomycetaceae bacterium]